MQKKALIIIPYFGQLPSYFYIFLKSVENNPNLQFLFLYDGQLNQSELPLNFEYRHFTIQQFNELASQKLAITTKLVSGYKLCDFKPTFGTLWEEVLKGYDYWGTSDIDLILGNTSAFLNSIFNEGYDIINLRDDYFAASFFLFKNNKTINNLFRLGKGWENVLSNEEYLGFDEHSKQWHLGKLVNKWTKYYELPNMTSIVNDATLELGIKVFRTKIIKESIFKDEILIYKNTEIISAKTNEKYFHYHYITEKQDKYLFQYPNWNEVPATFYISKAGFFDASVFNLERTKSITKIKIRRYYIYRKSIGFLKRCVKRVKRII